MGDNVFETDAERESEDVAEGDTDCDASSDARGDRDCAGLRDGEEVELLDGRPERDKEGEGETLAAADDGAGDRENDAAPEPERESDGERVTELASEAVIDKDKAALKDRAVVSVAAMVGGKYVVLLVGDGVGVPEGLEPEDIVAVGVDGPDGVREPVGVTLGVTDAVSDGVALDVRDVDVLDEDVMLDVGDGVTLAVSVGVGDMLGVGDGDSDDVGVLLELAPSERVAVGVDSEDTVEESVVVPLAVGEDESVGDGE